jgi:signal peptidase II
MQGTEDSSPAGTAAPARPRAYPTLFWGAALAVLLLDQATKAIVRASLDRGESWPDWDFPFRLTYLTNSGAAWGILQDQTVFLIVMAVIGIGAIYLYYRNPPYGHWSASLGIGLLLGGALGNLTDRIRLGRVTDFFDPDNFPAFNVADSAINVGIAVLVIGYLARGSKESTREPQAERAEESQDERDAPAEG